MSLSAKEIATRCAAAMWKDDAASKWLGMEISDVDEGYAVLTLTVEPHHANGHGICHGGVTFSLADSAFAFACNSRNQSAVAQHNVISYLAPANVGDRLTATATELSMSGRSGIYDVKVTNQDGLVLAEMRGFSRSIKGNLFQE